MLHIQLRAFRLRGTSRPRKEKAGREAPAPPTHTYLHVYSASAVDGAIN